MEYFPSSFATRMAEYYIRFLRPAKRRRRSIGRDPLASCFCFELRGVSDSLAIRVATVPVSVPFSVQSKICKITINIELGLL